MQTSSVGRTSCGAGTPACSVDTRVDVPLVSNPRRSACAASGVTLLEMVVVLALIGLIVAVSGPSVSAGIDSIRMTTASDSIASFLNTALTHAERKQQPVEVIISQKESKFTAISNVPGFTREMKLPDGIFIE